MSKHDHSKIYKKYNNLKEENTITFVLDGDFYRTFDNDAKIVSNVMKYKMYNNMVGFPRTSSPRVMEELDKNLIRYHFIEDDVVSKVGKRVNQYSTYLNLAIRTEYVQNKINELCDLVRDLILDNPDNYTKIKNLIGSLNESK